MELVACLLRVRNRRLQHRAARRSPPRAKLEGCTAGGESFSAHPQRAAPGLVVVSHFTSQGTVMVAFYK